MEEYNLVDFNVTNSLWIPDMFCIEKLLKKIY